MKGFGELISWFDKSTDPANMSVGSVKYWHRLSQIIVLRSCSPSAERGMLVPKNFVESRLIISIITYRAPVDWTYYDLVRQKGGSAKLPKT